jgi:hypothetical protein
LTAVIVDNLTAIRINVTQRNAKKVTLERKKTDPTYLKPKRVATKSLEESTFENYYRNDMPLQ